MQHSLRFFLVLSLIPDHFAFCDFGAIYAGNKSGCDDGGL